MKKIGILLITGVLIIGNSCQKYLEDVNVNPNSATDASLENMVTSAMVTFLGYNEGSDARIAGMWSQQFTGSDRQYAGIGAYQVNSGDFDFFQPYIGCATTADLAIVKAEELGNLKAAGALKVIKAATFGYAASVFGDVPYSEALNVEEFPNPNYDAQAAVYAGVQTELSAAISDLGGAGGIPGDIFGLSATQWIAVAHTFKARYFLHTGDYASAITEASAGIQSGGDMMGTHGTAKGGDRNMWYDFMVDERGGYMTAHDAHLPLIMDPTSPMYIDDAGKTDETERFAYFYTGAYNATGSSIYEPNTAAGAMFGMESSYPLITFAENQLILAEAEMKDGSPSRANAIAALNSVRAELRTMFPGGTYTDFVDADFATDADLLMAIYVEKYKSLIAQTEAFHDMNRLGNPFGLTPIQGTQLPQRFLYPQSEVNANSNFPGIVDVFVKLPSNN